jgi:hypothetical protein
MKYAFPLAVLTALAVTLTACKEKIAPSDEASPSSSSKMLQPSVGPNAEKARPKRITAERIAEIKAAGRTGFWSELTAVCPGVREATMLTWNIPDGAGRHVVYVIDKDGRERNFGQGGPVGEKMTGQWLQAGLVFKLRAAGDKREIATLTIGRRTDC